MIETFCLQKVVLDAEGEVKLRNIPMYMYSLATTQEGCWVFN